MNALFGAPGLAALDAVMRRSPLLAFDFDGTLAPIVARPEDAAVPAGVAARLGALARVRPVAIVSGRSIVDLSPRLGFAPAYIVGSHGAEGPGRAANADPSVLDAARRLIAAHAGDLRQAGVEVEDKGLSLALHYRLAADPDAAFDRIGDTLAGLDPALKRFGGKCVVNIVAADAPDKGDAVRALVADCGCGSAVFVGDDVNDEAVFEIAAPHWLTVRIGCDDPRSAAMFCLDAFAGIEALLDRLLALSAGDAGRA